ncbi:MAG: GGDEF domain-containing protein [Mycobacteriales bacterium]
MRPMERRYGATVLLVVLIALVDAALPSIDLLAFLVVPVLLASTFATALRTALCAALATAAAIALGVEDGIVGTFEHSVRVAGVVVVSAFAVYVAHDRATREADLERQALHDPLTGLANRTLLVDRLRQLVLRRRPGGLLAVVFVDVDRFKSFNDSYGHAAGDEVLRHVARSLLDVTRSGDTVSRFAGDEFVVLYPDLPDLAEAGAVAERIQAALAAPLPLGGAAVTATASVGVAVDQGTGVGAEALLRAADEAMYDSKSRGGSCFTVTVVDGHPPRTGPPG